MPSQSGGSLSTAPQPKQGPWPPPTHIRPPGPFEAQQVTAQQLDPNQELDNMLNDGANVTASHLATIIQELVPLRGVSSEVTTVALSVGDIVKCRQAVASAGELSEQIDVGCKCKVQRLRDHEAFIEFQQPSLEYVTMKHWVHACEWHKLAVQSDSEAEGGSDGSVPEDLSSCEPPRTEHELNISIEAVGGF